ncbi:MAG: ferredoxin reductase family protein [Candidatus Limnocylindria bacterium]
MELTPAVPARPFAGQPGRDVIWGLFYANLVAILFLWWAGSGHDGIKTAADALNAIGRVTALVGTYLVLWELLLMARVPWLDDAFGMEGLVVLHRRNGYLLLGLLVSHAITQTIGYALDNGYGLMQQLGDFVDHYDGLVPAIAALVLLIAVTGVSLSVARRRFSYQTWYFIHLYAYLAVALAFAHELAVGIDFIHAPLAVAYWWALYLVVAGALLVFRVARPLRRYRRHRFRVDHVEREAHEAVSVYVTGRDIAALPVEAGQFFLWRFLDGARWFEAHPFSLSSRPGGPHLRFTTKKVGEYTARLAKLRPGTPVLVEGPFGRFTREACRSTKALLVGGGIGIAPIRPLAEALARDGVDVCVLYRCRRQRDIAFRDELDALASRHGVRVEYLVSNRGPKGWTHADWFQPNSLVKLVPDIDERDVFICGPQGMTRHLVQTLRSLGTRPDRIHTEAFVF